MLFRNEHKGEEREVKEEQGEGEGGEEGEVMKNQRHSSYVTNIWRLFNSLQLESWCGEGSDEDEGENVYSNEAAYHHKQHPVLDHLVVGKCVWCVCVCVWGVGWGGGGGVI